MGVARRVKFSVSSGWLDRVYFPFAENWWQSMWLEQTNHKKNNSKAHTHTSHTQSLLACTRAGLSFFFFFLLFASLHTLYSQQLLHTMVRDQQTPQKTGVDTLCSHGQ